MAEAHAELLHALNRFGLGPRPGDARAAATDPRGFAVSQLSRKDTVPLATPALVPSSVAYGQYRLQEIAKERDRLRVAAAQPPGPPAGQSASLIQPPGPGMAQPGAQTAMVAGPPAARPAPAPLSYEQQVYRAELGARIGRWTATDTPLLERLVMFWANHFAVSVSKGGNLRVLAGAFEREAIRPHVLGSFVDMLKAVETHPAMLFFLDNQSSIGPASRNGLQSKRGLNENLAREILELHTLGVDGGYTQEDVTALARVITGWTVTSPDDDITYGGRFTYAPARHEPGAHEVLGIRYPETPGPDQGFAVLEALARHPSTGRFLARKLARHFVADEPPPALVDRLAQRFADTGGDLGAVTRALVEAPESWSLPATKMKSPVELLAAGARASGSAPDVGVVLNALTGLGQPLWAPPGPNGWSDRAGAWMSPEGMDGRLDVAAQWGRLNGQLNPRDLLDQLFGPAASAETRQAVSRAETRPQGLAILMMSPEFQRR